MSLVFFYAQDGETRVTMDNESVVRVSYPSTVSKSSTMSGQTVSDEVIEGNASISVSGKVTYSKLNSQKNNLDPIQFQNAIQQVRRNRSKFTLFIQDNGQPLLQDFENCVITNFTPEVSVYSDTITVSLEFEQVFVSQSAKVSYLAPKPKAVDKPSLSNTKDSGQATSSLLGNRTIASAVSDYLSTLTGAEAQAQEITDGTNN